MATQPASAELLEQHGITSKRLTVCVAFDGVIHSCRSRWQGAEFVNDPPILKVEEVIKRLRRDFRIVVQSTRCHSEAGRLAIVNWLAKHKIEVDEVCELKPPAHVYIDDRAVSFTGDWYQKIPDV